MRAGGKFHCPFGRPELSPDSEYKWRRRMAEAAVKALTHKVEKPTVFVAERLLAGQAG
jgi:hypothetical protein